MTPDDPRHGTEAGHTAHYRSRTTPCAPCLRAHRIANNLRDLYPAKTLAIGSQRRIQALQAIGHGRDRIARELGYTDGGSLTNVMQQTTMTVTLANRIAEVYERLCMVIPVGQGPARARTWAKRHGYAPPLAWDNIDDPNERPNGVGYADTRRNPEDLDPAVVERLLDGRRVPGSTRAEKDEVMRRWLANGGSEVALCRLHGWQEGRYGRGEQVAS